MWKSLIFEVFYYQLHWKLKKEKRESQVVRISIEIPVTGYVIVQVFRCHYRSGLPFVHFVVFCKELFLSHYAHYDDPSVYAYFGTIIKLELIWHSYLTHSDLCMCCHPFLVHWRVGGCSGAPLGDNAKKPFLQRKWIFSPIRWSLLFLLLWFLPFPNILLLGTSGTSNAWQPLIQAFTFLLLQKPDFSHVAVNGRSGFFILKPSSQRKTTTSPALNRSTELSRATSDFPIRLVYILLIFNSKSKNEPDIGAHFGRHYVCDRLKNSWNPPSSKFRLPGTWLLECQQVWC